MTDAKYLDVLLRHINDVGENCEILGYKLIEHGEADSAFFWKINFGVKLIANGKIHDQSKFHGIEWLHLRDGADPALQKVAIQQHQLTNAHHPEYWHSIHNMPNLFLAEMVCDWYARSHVFGTDLRSWIRESATKKYLFDAQHNVYWQIFEYVDLLLEKPFV